MKKKALIIHQSTSTRKMLREILMAENWHTVEVETSEEGLAYCDYSLPHCIFLEKNMPEIDGLEFINFFNYNHPKATTKIILCAKNDKNITLEELDQQGGHFISTSPFNKEDTSQYIRNI
jgi:PleD family two-component response regulator